MREWFILKVATFRQVIAGWVWRILCLRTYWWDCWRTHRCLEHTEWPVSECGHSNTKFPKTAPHPLGLWLSLAKFGYWSWLQSYTGWMLSRSVCPLIITKAFLVQRFRLILWSTGWKEELQKKPILNFVEINSCLHIIGNFLGPSLTCKEDESSSWLRPCTSLIPCNLPCWVS